MDKMVDKIFLIIILFSFPCISEQNFCITFYPDSITFNIYCIKEGGNFVTSKSEYENIKLKNKKCNYGFINLMNRFRKYIEENPNYCDKEINVLDRGGYIFLEVEGMNCIIDYEKKEFDNNLLNIIYEFKVLTRKCGKNYDAGYKGYGEAFINIIQTQYELKAKIQKVKQNIINILERCLKADLNFVEFLNKWPHDLEKENEYLYDIFKDVQKAIHLYSNDKEEWEKSLEFKVVYIDYLLLKELKSYANIKLFRNMALKEIEKAQREKLEDIIYRLLKSEVKKE